MKIEKITENKIRITLKREEFKDIATRTKGSKIRATFNKIKDFVYAKEERGDKEDNVRT